MRICIPYIRVPYPYMEPVAVTYTLSTNPGDLQEPAATQHYVHLDHTDTPNL